jgi:signal recognition particle subunit SRP19
LKDYNKIILWLDYFNSNLSRSEGRKVPLNQAISNPNISEIIEAIQRIGYEGESQIAFFPKRNQTPSGYVSILKNKRKSNLIKEVSRLLGVIRGENRLGNR